MHFKSCIMPVSVFYILLICSAAGHGEPITLHIPIIDEAPSQHFFFHELLEKALRQEGHTVRLVTPSMPQLRTKKELEEGELSIYWMVESAERNRKYVPVGEGLTQGLIGNRILFIRKGTQGIYDRVYSLDDFRNLNLTAGMGQDWFDIKVWKENRLAYLEHPGNWKGIFSMIPLGRDYDYISRGINEILNESMTYPDLAIEKRLVLIYKRDFRFYLSSNGKNAGVIYRREIHQALMRAAASGLNQKLIQKYWAINLKWLNYGQRVKLHLKTPD